MALLLQDSGCCSGEIVSLAASSTAGIARCSLITLLVPLWRDSWPLPSPSWATLEARSDFFKKNNHLHSWHRGDQDVLHIFIYVYPAFISLMRKMYKQSLSILRKRLEIIVTNIYKGFLFIKYLFTLHRKPPEVGIIISPFYRQRN